MGAAAGHLLHPHENPSLTFRDIKIIFEKIAQGKMLVTEKLDGTCLHLSFSVKDGKARAARNYKNISEGGITLENVNLLTETTEVLPSFTEAIKIFEQVVKKIPTDELIEIFGPNANYYYNCEILNPNNPNVILYNQPMINFHRTGHLKFDKFQERIVPEILGEQFLRLENLLSNTSLNEQTDNGFVVRTNPIRQIKELNDKTPYYNGLKSLQFEINKYNLSNNSTIAEYILNRVDEIIKPQISEFSNESKKILVKKLMKVDGVTNKNVYDSLNKTNSSHLIEKAKEILNSQRKILKEAVSPVEQIITEFGAGILKEFKSSYIEDEAKEITRLKSKLQEIFDIVGTSNNPEAQLFLNNQFKRIKNIDNINSACEGIVFKYDGNVYKLTGMFSPLNQILGMMKFSRGNVPPLKTLLSMNENKTVVLSWGRFNPPTIGHEIVFKFANDLAKQNKADFFIVPTKTTDKQKNPLTIQEKITYLNKIFPEYTNNLINSSQINTIIEAAKYFSNKGYKNLKLVVGSDRKEQFEILNKYNNKDYNFNSIEIVSAGERLDEGEGAASISASKMREAAIQGDIDVFMRGVAGRLELEEGVKLMNLIRSRIEVVDGDKKKFLEPVSPSLLAEVIRKSGNKWCVFSKSKTKEGKKKKLGCYNSRNGAKKRLRQVEYFKSISEGQEIDEMSASGGGAIVGNVAPKKLEQEINYNYGESHSGNGLGTQTSKYGSSMKRDDEPSRKEKIKILIMQEEQFMINRKEFIEEIKLRKIIREGLKIKMKEREQKILQEEKELRLVIRKLLQEADDEEAPHSSTGINILEDLLKKIIKIVKTDYKRITTNPAQRKSFRAHIINATINALKTEKATENASEPEEKLEEIVVEEKPDPRFIDVGLDPKEPEPAPEDKFTIPGQDFTGRNMALKTMKKIEKQILEAYQMLSDKKDKDLFYEYLIVNLKLYFDKFESEMSADTQEPGSDTYEKEKQQIDSSPEPEEQAPEPSSQLPSSNPEQPPPASPNPLAERRRKK